MMERIVSIQKEYLYNAAAVSDLRRHCHPAQKAKVSSRFFQIQYTTILARENFISS